MNAHAGGSYGVLTFTFALAFAFDFELDLNHQPEFDFIGTTSFKWSLRGGEEIVVPLKARFYAGGVYNLQSVRLTVLKSNAPVPYLFPLQWTIFVEEDA